ncbi:MAG TPA: CoA transferase [Myxococcota bacterium]|nr:CoA transferase [Myxococcota bacterium]
MLKGVRVIECAEHTFVPVAATTLADWGADVVKIERASRGGDSSRHMLILQRPGQKLNGFFEVANRGKRGLALDLTRAEGREALYRAIPATDVFVTSLRESARKKMGVEPEVLMQINPRLIYARGTGYGLRGPLASAPGFDHPSSWCRAGSAFAQDARDGTPPPPQPGSVGDLTGGATLAGAICAALFRRERTGKGAIVDHALYGMGTYIMTQSLASASLAGAKPSDPVGPRAAGFQHPLVHSYQTKDARFLQLCFLQDRWFPDLARRLGREDLLADPRFADEPSKLAHAQALIDALQAEFVKKTLHEWCDVLVECEGVWAPQLRPVEVLSDEQALVNGFVTPVRTHDGDSYLAAATPGQFDERPVGALAAAPAWGQHTREVLRDWGLSEAEVAALERSQVALQG